MRFLNKLLINIIIFACFIINTYSLDWPVVERVLLTCFGENNGSSFYTGIDLGGEHQNVYPVADGEIIFYHKENESYSTVPRGNGNLLAVQHEGEIQSIYSHLEKDSIILNTFNVKKRPGRIKSDLFENSILEMLEDADAKESLLEGFIKDDDYYIYSTEEINEREQLEIWNILFEIGFAKPIARIGDSGAAEGPYLFFMLIDISEHIIINPIFKEDNTPLTPPITPRRPRYYEGPLIEELLLGSDDAMHKIYDAQSISSGTGSIYTKAYCISDFSDYEKRMVPYRFTLISNGVEVSTIVLNALEEQGNRFVLWNTDTGYEDLYTSNVFGKKWLLKLGSINFLEGVSNISLTVEDIFGMESRITVQLQIF